VLTALDESLMAVSIGILDDQITDFLFAIPLSHRLDLTIMNGHTSHSLFGGAIKAKIPSNFLDARYFLP
jgi:hypothetical protein